LVGLRIWRPTFRALVHRLIHQLGRAARRTLRVTRLPG
jgi:hypothetical protein